MRRPQWSEKGQGRRSHERTEDTHTYGIPQRSIQEAREPSHLVQEKPDEEELNSLPAVQKGFKVELEKGLKAAFSKDLRRDLISTVCHINRVILNIVLMADFGHKELSNWPCVEIGGIKVSPLQNDRVLKVLKKRGMEHCFGTLELLRGEYGSLIWPVSIASNSLGQFLVANDDGDKRAKLFDSRGKVLNSFSLKSDASRDDVYCICQVATDLNGKIYVLVELKPCVKSILKDNNPGNLGLT